MHRRFRIASLASAAVFALVALSAAALAAPKDAAAKKLDKDAMDNDYLTASFDAAEKKLSDAVKTCGDSGCTPKVKAQILVHLGIVQVNASKTSEAEKSFVEALKLDSSVAPESDFTSADVEKAFNEAKKKAGGGKPSSTGEPSGPSEPSGEMTHEQVKEQMVSTPVPIYVQAPEGMKVGKVIVMFKPFGSPDWKKLELKQIADGWGGLIDCRELGTTGDLKYYVKALDPSGDQVAGLGSTGKPFITKIKNQLDGDPPHLPKQPPPAQCARAEDCPPGLPGCPTGRKHGDKGWGASCEKSEECQKGLICKSGTCEEGAEEPGGGEGEPATGAAKKNWLGLVFSPDLAWVSGDDVCGRESQQSKGFTCFKSDGSQYHGWPYASMNGNAIAGGMALSTLRVMALYDRVFGKNITAGARLGFAFNGGPQPEKGNAFLPVHAELRLGYWFGQNPFAKVGLRPFIFLSAGMAQVDSKVDVLVKEDPQQCAGTTAGACPYADATGRPVYPVSTPDRGVIQENPPAQTVSAWRKAGQSFIGFGGGIVYAISAKGGPMFDVKISQMFPTTGTVISPELGYVFGF